MKQHPVMRFIASFAICISAGYLNLYMFTESVPLWYGTLTKPAFVPPPIVIFYGIIAVSILLGLCFYSILGAIYADHEAASARNLFLFGIGLSVIWFSAVFLLHLLLFGFVVMLLLLVVILATLFKVLQSAPRIAILLVPYLIIMIIVAFANLELYRLNPLA